MGLSITTRIVRAGCALHDPEALLQPGVAAHYETLGDVPGTPEVSIWGWRAEFLTDATETGSQAFVRGTREDGPDAALEALLGAIHDALRARADEITAAILATGG